MSFEINGVEWTPIETSPEIATLNPILSTLRDWDVQDEMLAITGLKATAFYGMDNPLTHIKAFKEGRVVVASGIDASNLDGHILPSEIFKWFHAGSHVVNLFRVRQEICGGSRLSLGAEIFGE